MIEPVAPKEYTHLCQVSCLPKDLFGEQVGALVGEIRRCMGDPFLTPVIAGGRRRNP